MSKDLTVGRYCDAYGALLTEHMRELVRSYYDYDLSLAEIAENFGITRQAALCSIKQAVKRLYAYEDALGVVAKGDELQAKLTLALGAVDDSEKCRQILVGLLCDLRQ